VVRSFKSLVILKCDKCIQMIFQKSEYPLGGFEVLKNKSECNPRFFSENQKKKVS
jgi:hypothetical protein